MHTIYFEYLELSERGALWEQGKVEAPSCVAGLIWDTLNDSGYTMKSTRP
jgi:hypothetical protein